ncbi:MAG: hypothetical protein ACRCTE_08795 [Cellulosilyticaceae bacterium]
MKQSHIKWMSVMLLCVLYANPILACNTTPRANTSTTSACVKQPFVIDNFKIIQAALEKLGVTPTELQQMIKEGKKLGEVLEVKHIPDAKFKKVLIKEYHTVIKKGLSEGQISKEEANMLNYAVKQKVKNWSSK